jgi:bifunctional DNase/RNase
MIEAKVDDVLVRVSETDPGRLAWFGRIIVLKEKHGDRALPIWSGPPEADLLFMSLRGQSTPRPMPHDLMAELIRALGARLERVAITHESEIAYHATLSVAVDGRREEVDARPSDALLLAVRTGSPILVAERMLDQHGVQARNLNETLPSRTAESEVMAAGGWRSLTPELLRSIQGAP